MNFNINVSAYLGLGTPSALGTSLINSSVVTSALLLCENTTETSSPSIDSILAW